MSREAEDLKCVLDYAQATCALAKERYEMAVQKVKEAVEEEMRSPVEKAIVKLRGEVGEYQDYEFDIRWMFRAGGEAMADKIILIEDIGRLWNQDKVDRFNQYREELKGD